MNNQPRHINLSTYLSILPQYPVIFRLAILFLALPLLIMSPAIYFISSFNTKPVNDYATIDREGIPLKASINSISINYDTKINNQHPIIINYTYLLNRKEVRSQTETLDRQEVQQLKTGDSVDIKVLNNESVIRNMKPFHFPFFIFYLLPLPFLLAGIILTIILVNRAGKKMSLYKYGDLKEAKLISVMRKPMTGRNNVGKNLLIADYEYAGLSGRKINGQSISNPSVTLINKKPGDAVKVFVSEKNEDISCLVPDNLLPDNYNSKINA